MAITTAAQAIAEINATNLTDGQQIKQLLADLTAFLSVEPAATTTTIGGVKQIPNIPAFTGGTDTTTQTNLNTLRTALVTAGIMVGP